MILPTKKKKIIISILLFILIFTSYKIILTPTMIRPYPYVVIQQKENHSKQLNGCHILVVGDRMGKFLDHHLAELSDNTSGNLKNPLKTCNLSSKNEGLHRTIAKLKSITKLPPIVIYHGASNEFYEQKFFVNDKKIIEANFLRYNNSIISTLVIILPFLSKILYQSPNIIKLDKIKENKKKYKANKKQEQMEIAYKIFGYELEELILHIKKSGSTPIILTAPINLETPPLKTCKNSVTEYIIDEQKKSQELIKSGETEKAYQFLKKLLPKTIANAKTYYTLGRVAQGLGKLKEARKLLELVSVFDCQQKRPNIIYNSIIKNKAAVHEILIADFNEMVNSDFGKNQLFLDELIPQEIYYRKLIETLSEMIRLILRL